MFGWKRKYLYQEAHRKACQDVIKRMNNECCASCTYSIESRSDKKNLLCTNNFCPCSGRIVKPSFGCKGYEENDI